MSATSSPGGVQGKPSPRWAVWSRFLIPCLDGVPYLRRLRVVQTPWFGVLLHNIFEPDGDRDPHNHPWPFASLVLRGYYVERVYDDPAGRPGEYRTRIHRRGSLHLMGTGSAHRIVEAAPGLKTLILTGPRRGGWGFYREGRFVSWQEYVHSYERSAA